jgi:hypothetical protein
MHLEIHDTIASGDHVVLRFTNRGTNVGPFMGRLRGLFGRAPAFPIRRDLSPTVAELCPVRYVGE